MNLRYHKWLDIEVTHTYFPENICPVVNLIPTNATAQIFKNYQILIRRQDNIMSLYIGLKEGESLDVSQQFEGISLLHFQVLIEDPQFFNYTGLKFPNEGELMFFSNLNKEPGATQLQTSQFANETDYVSKRPEVFSVSITANDSLLEIRTLDGTMVINQDLSQAQFPEYSINLSGQESGVYQLFLNSELKDTFFMTSERMNPNIMGMIQLDMESFKSNYEEGMAYHIDFNARVVHRQYKVIIPSADKMETSSIEIEGMEGEQYNGPVEEELTGNQTAQVFTSDIPLPLQQKLDKNPQLKGTYTTKFSSRTMELEMKLPNPSADYITANTNEENEVSFFSSTIIYV